MKHRMYAILAALALLVSISVATSGRAYAHEHQICTPGAGDPVLKEEPFHGGDPTNGAILNNPHVTQANYDAWGLHPLHNFLHVGPAGDNRAITIVRTDRATCP